MTTLLKVKDLVKRYKDVNAVNGIDLDIEQGSCLGLLGPNGAGKTTTIEMMEGITAPTSGSIHYRDAPLGETFRNEAGIMFQSTALQDFITVREVLRMFARLYPRTRAIDDLIARCALQEFIDRDASKLSGGQRQRVLLAVALVNAPHIVFLDEPTTGLDPQARRNFWDLVKDIRDEGTTVVLSTHYMEEAYALCSEIAIMDHGKIIAQGTPRTLLAKHFNDVVLQLPKTDIPQSDTPIPLAMITRDDQVEIRTEDVNASIETLIAHGISLARLQIRPRSLEDLFIELTGKELRA